MAPRDLLGTSLALLIPRNTGLVLRKVSLSRFENLFIEFEFSSIYFDGDIGIMLDFLPSGLLFLLVDCCKKFEHLLSNRLIEWFV